MPATGLLSAIGLCERALRKIQAFSINETAARPEYMHEALIWLSLLLDHLSGTQRRYWLLSETMSVPLNVANQRTYDNIDTLVGSSWPANGVGMPVMAWIETTGGQNRWPLQIVRREEFEEVSRTAQSGEPIYVYFDPAVDPDLSPKFSVYPVPAVATYIMRVIFQLMPNRVAPATVSGAIPKPSGKADHGLRRSWQMWAITALAAELGDGPIRKLDGSTIRAWRDEAEAMLTDLESYEDTQHETTPPVVSPGWDYGSEDTDSSPGLTSDYGNRVDGWN